jgi:ABC-type molybdate transport system substrate-binding protein
LLRERVEKGEAAHVFASADAGHPTKLAAAGRAGTPVVIFARNQLCALAREGLPVTSENLLATMLDPAVRVGTSTPKADPSGDYAFALFAKAEAIKPGAKAALEAKALKLTGGPSSEKAPAGRNQYAWVMAGGKADVFLTYCTNAVLAKKELPRLQIVQIPRDLNVGADYGMVVLKDAPPAALELARFITGVDGQGILAKYGFGPGDPSK